MKQSNLVMYGQTINLMVGCFGMGLMTSLISITLVDLTEVYVSPMDMVSYIITFRGVGAVLGSLFGGMLLDKFNTQILITTAMLIASMTICLIPICSSLPIAFGVTLIYGFTFGIFDKGANIWIINLWGKKNGPILQIYNFAFGLGGLLSPIVAEPFLSVCAGDCDDLLDTSSPDAALNATAVFKKSRIAVPYALIAFIHFALFVSMFVLYKIEPRDSEPAPAALKDDVTASKPERFTLLMCLLLPIHLMLHVASESCLVGMVATFAVKSKLRFTKSRASYLSSVFWTIFTMSRVFSPFWAKFTTPKQMMFIENAMTIVALGTFRWSGETNLSMVWVCASMVGIGAGGMFATSMTRAVEFMLLTNRMISFSTVFSGSGGAASPFIAGNSIDENPMALIYAFSGLSAIFIMFMMWLITSTMKPRKSMVMDNTEQEGANDLQEKVTPEDDTDVTEA